MSGENAAGRYWREARASTWVPPRRPWLASALAGVAAAGVAIGSLVPWLYRESATRTPGSHDTDLLIGWQTDGLFALILAVVAVGAILIALFRADSAWVAWVGFVALAICALIGFYDWSMFGNVVEAHLADHPENVAERRWGLAVVAIAGPVGAVCAFLVARQLNRE